MASVSGRRMVKREPSPCFVSMCSAPPSFLISLATTSMPTPRPDSVLTAPAVEKPGSSTSCMMSSSESCWSARTRPTEMPLSRIALRFMPAPSSETSTTTSEPSRCSAMVMVPLSLLPRLLALFGRLDAVRDRVAQHVLERRHHALEHLAIELAGGAFDLQLGLLVRVGGGLAHDAREALHVTLERNHARAHEAVLQFGDGARLLGQQVLRVLRERFEQLLNAADVVRRFGEAARELLDRGVAVELERIEVALLALLFFEAMQDLRFGFELELAQLLLEARDGARQLADVEVDGTDLLFETGARDARFAGIVEQLVEQFGVDARELGTIGRCGRFAARRHGARRQQRPVARAFGVFVRAITVEPGGHGFPRRGTRHDGRRLGRRRPHGREHRRLGQRVRRAAVAARTQASGAGTAEIVGTGAGLGTGAGAGAGATMGGGGGTAITGAGAAMAGAGAGAGGGQRVHRRAVRRRRGSSRRPACR